MQFETEKPTFPGLAEQSCIYQRWPDRDAPELMTGHHQSTQNEDRGCADAGQRW
jgi:hypothetical protein